MSICSVMRQLGFKSGDFNEGRKDLAVVLIPYGKSAVFCLISRNWWQRPQIMDVCGQNLQICHFSTKVMLYDLGFCCLGPCDFSVGKNTKPRQHLSWQFWRSLRERDFSD